MSLLQILRDARGPLTRADRKRWAQVRNLRDVGELHALWLLGRMKSLPSYYDKVDVDEYDAPGLTAALVACNRAGFVTLDSQAGTPESPGYDGALWRGRAFVDGFADDQTLEWLRQTVRTGPSGTKLYAHKLVRRQRPGDVPGSERQDERGGWQTTCWAVGYLTYEDVDLYYGDFPAAHEAARQAHHVSVVDLRWGRNTLWRHLERAARRWSR